MFTDLIPINYKMLSKTQHLMAALSKLIWEGIGPNLPSRVCLSVCICLADCVTYAKIRWYKINLPSINFIQGIKIYQRCEEIRKRVYICVCLCGYLYIYSKRRNLRISENHKHRTTMLRINSILLRSILCCDMQDCWRETHSSGICDGAKKVDVSKNMCAN